MSENCRQSSTLWCGSGFPPTVELAGVVARICPVEVPVIAIPMGRGSAVLRCSS